MTALWVLLLLYGPAELFWLAMVVVAACGLWEFFRLTMSIPTPGLLALQTMISILPVAAALSGRSQFLLPALFVSLFCLILLVLARPAEIGKGLHTLGAGSLGALYIGFCLAHLVLLRFLPQGNGWLLVLTAVTACGDTGAYYIGSTLGRHKLCPRISPKKTVEGAVGGVVSAVICAVAVGWYLLPRTSPWLIFGAGLLLSLVSIAGDLAESVLKRSVGVKDSGTLLGGHGGVLDRIDSLLLAGPVLYYLLLLAGRLE